MKVEVSALQKKFEPITLTITIETREELLDMYARHTIQNGKVVAAYRDGGGNREDVISACWSTPMDPPLLDLLVRLRDGLA